MGVLVLLAAYVAGYSALSKKTGPTLSDQIIERQFESRFACKMYWPLGWIECKARQMMVIHICPSDPSDGIMGSGRTGPFYFDGNSTYDKFYP